MTEEPITVDRVTLFAELRERASGLMLSNTRWAELSGVSTATLSRLLSSNDRVARAQASTIWKLADGIKVAESEVARKLWNKK